MAVQSFIEHERVADREELLSLLRRYNSPLTLTLTLHALGIADHHEQVKKIAEGVNIAPYIATRLPFSLSAQRIEEALLAQR